MLELRNIVFKAVSEKERDIIKDVNMTIEDESLVVVTGPNGGGKSTLAKIIAGIEKPTSGKVVFDGVDITDMSVTDRAKTGIGFAFQQPVRFKGLTVKDLIQLAASKPLTTDAACVYLSEVGLCAIDYVDRELDASLSGGELKRIEIAMLIARGTRLSVFDEPEAGIDLWSFHNLIKVFEKLRRQTKGSIMIISHQERILDIADKIVVLAGGRITQTGTKSEILPGLLDELEDGDQHRIRW
jgi:Fe-S cluster assembly ATP-binding protein